MQSYFVLPVLFSVNLYHETCALPDICRTVRPQEDKDNFCNAVRSELKQAGVMDTPDNCWDFFVNKVQSSCHKHRYGVPNPIF